MRSVIVQLLAWTSAAAIAGCGADRTAEPPGPRAAEARSASWVALGRLSAGSPLDVDGAALTTVKDGAYAIVVHRGPSGKSSHLFAFRLIARGWELAGPPLPVDRGARVEPIGGGRDLCVASMFNRQGGIRCLASRQWVAEPQALFRSSTPADGAIASAAEAHGRVTVVRQRIRRPSGRSELTVWRGRHRQQMREIRGQIAARYAKGATRPIAMELRDQGPCIAFEGGPADPTFGNEIAVECLTPRGWEEKGPSIRNRRAFVLPGQRRQATGLMLSGATTLMSRPFEN